MELTGFASRRNLRGVSMGMAQKRPEQPYSDFLTSLDRHGEPPSSGGLDRVLKGLRHDLRVEIRRRGLWDKSPRVLGMVGYERWDWGGFHSEQNGEGQEALDELVVDCYVYIFVTRLRSLLGQLKTKGNVDGLVKRSVRNFVHDTQRKHDPLGFRVYKVFRRAVEQSVKERRLFILEEHRRLCNDTLLGFHPKAQVHQERDEGTDLTDAVARWNDALLPDLMTAQGPKLKSVVETFQEKLLTLETEGVGCFRCRDVMDPLKSDARQRWATVWGRGDGRGLIGDHGTPLLNPVGGGSDGFIALSSCVDQKLQQFQGQKRTRNHLLKLWDYLKEYAVADINGEAPVSWDAMQEKLPSHRELAKQLNIPRDRLPGLYETIRQATQGCLNQSKSSSALRVVPETPPCAVRRNAMKDRRDELLQRTGEAYQQLREETALPAPQAGSSRLGALYALEESSGLGLEWLALESGDGGCWHMVPADPHPWIGSVDLPLNGLGPLTLRCQAARWLDKKIFDHAYITATLDDAQLARVAHHMQDLQKAAELADDDQMETDDDPDYIEWCRQIQETTETLACLDWTKKTESQGDEPSKRQRRGGFRGPKGLGDGFLARAAIVVLALGLTHWSGRWIEHQGQSGAIHELQTRYDATLSSLKAQGEQLGMLQTLIQQGFSGKKVMALLDSVQVRGEIEILEVPEETQWVLLLLDLPSLEMGDRLRITALEDNRVVWEDPNVGWDRSPEKKPQWIPATLLPSGVYRVEVERHAASATLEVFVRDLRVVHT